uniref:Uncharacterized protein n=1 Tax=Arundo donax TaxID=35708 RepID=A0A0A9A270_ARUDO
MGGQEEGTQKHAEVWKKGVPLHLLRPARSFMARLMRDGFLGKRASWEAGAAPQWPAWCPPATHLPPGVTARRR